jgi:hypothetical protein
MLSEPFQVVHQASRIMGPDACRKSGFGEGPSQLAELLVGHQHGKRAFLHGAVDFADSARVHQQRGDEDIGIQNDAQRLCFSFT